MQALTDILFARLLLKHKKIVLQGIGTFTLTETPATAQRMGRDFQPPKAAVTFSIQEDNDKRLRDILLQDDEFNISMESDAAEICNNYIVGIKFQLEKNGQYSFSGLGNLQITKNGESVFVQDDDSYNYGLPEFTADIVAKQVAAAPVIKPKRKRRVRAWLILLILIIGGGITSWFLIPEVPENVLPLWEKAISVFDRKEPVTDTTTTKAVDTTQNVMVEPDTIMQDTTQKDTIITEGPLSYFVIAGSFADKTEAETFCNNLKQRGYPEAMVVISEADRRIRVAYKGFSTRETALDFLNKTKTAENKSDIWLLHQNL
ncbi:MAG: SPOR domain-containing protein [Bacteroidales bacterium]|jgi:nucleoid DNA-binding protein|nr:SPOR domain-containing protein [Bacteroidales bacterium]